ncbi:MAG: biotin--[acetyl-CoA-carboxylase] ligase, partial [Acidimicrobiia bacterium]
MQTEVKRELQNRIQRADSDTSITAAGSYDARQINEALRGQRFFRALVVEKIDSTNTALFELGRAGEPEGLVLLAEEQSAGRGRMGRSWTSPKGKSILMSVLARARVSSEDAGLVNAAAGLAVVDAVRDVSSLDTKLKWPNDIVFEGKKLGGILTERGSDREGRPFFVIGIGLNVEWRPEDFPPDIAETATALSIVAGSPPQRRA